MAFTTGLEGKPWYYGVIAGLVVGGGLYYGAHVWLLKPKSETLAQQETELATLQSKIQEGRAAKQQLPRFREEVRQLNHDLDKLRLLLPSARDTHELLRRVRMLTEQGHFGFQRFTPSPEVQQDFYSEYPIAISLRGSYHNLALLFESVSRFSRIINVENLEVAALRDFGQNRTLEASFRAKTFVYRDTPSAEESEEVQP